MRSYLLEDYTDGKLPLYVACPQHPDHGLHSHDFTELVIIFAGHGIHFTEEGECSIGAGDVFVIPKFLSHGYRDASSLTLVNFMLDLERLPIFSEDISGLPEEDDGGTAGFDGKMMMLFHALPAKAPGEGIH